MGRVHLVDHTHLLITDFHSLDQRPDDLAARGPIRPVHPLLDSPCEPLQLPDHQSQCLLLLALPEGLPLLLLEPGDPPTGRQQPGLELLPLQQPVAEGIDQPRHPTPRLLDQVCQRP